tara:strand:- start:460 stop:777 length:318 start_codon:yes stop_codon:yes gene_type:complete
MSTLQFIDIDEAFSPLAIKKKKVKFDEQKYQEKETSNSHQIITQREPQQVQINPPIVSTTSSRTFADELVTVQPYINNLFMLLVLGMLYDIRMVALDCKSKIMAS